MTCPEVPYRVRSHSHHIEKYHLITHHVQLWLAQAPKSPALATDLAENTFLRAGVAGHLKSY